MITYEFPIKNFKASDGYTNIKVVDSKLELPGKPDNTVLALIEKHDGKEVKEMKEIKARKKRGKV